MDYYDVDNGNITVVHICEATNESSKSDGYVGFSFYQKFIGDRFSNGWVISVLPSRNHHFLFNYRGKHIYNLQELKLLFRETHHIDTKVCK